LIMSLVGDRDSWDSSSLMMGMMGGMGGGMGMMGGGMGMMGGGRGMMGGMGGGMRSVPPTSLPNTTLKPHQTRHLPTPVVSLDRPKASRGLAVPAKGEKLRVGSIDQVTNDTRTRAALKRLGEDKAPQTIAQLVLWNVSAGLDWDTIARDSKPWANEHELALARKFVRSLDEPREPLATNTLAPPPDSGRLYWDLTSKGDHAPARANALRTSLAKQIVLGLTATEGVPVRPDGPALAWRGEIDDTKLSVRLMTSDNAGADWVPVGEFVLKCKPETTTKEELTHQALETADELAAGLLVRLVRVELSKPKRVNDRLVYQIQIANDSPLILSGLAVSGPEDSAKAEPKTLAGLSLPPHKSMSMPATSEQVQRLGLKEGMRVVAANLSGL